MAAWALSRIDSPSRPVRVKLPLARHAGRLDEEDLAAGRGPGQPGGDARGSPSGRPARGRTATGPAASATRLGIDRGRPALPLGAAAGDLAADRRDLALEVPQAGLAGVVGDDLPDRRVGDLQVLGRQAVGLELLGDDVLLRDQRLLLLAVAGELEHLHAGRAGASGIVSSMFAVAMNITFERSKSTSR